jgi:hypothetical protein
MPERTEVSDRPLNLSDYLLWGLLFLLAFTLPSKPLLELDSSWRQALAYFLHRGYPFGDSIVFTYGPLGFLMGNTYTGMYWGGYILWQSFFSFVAASMVIHVGRNLKGVSRFSYFAFFILWGMGYADALHMIIIAFSGWIMIQRLASDRSVWAIPFGLFLAILAVIKFTNLLFTGFVVLVVLGYALSAQKRRNGLQLLLSFSLGFLAIWLACGQSPFQWLDYALNSLEISSGYQAAMGLPTPDGQLAIALWIFASLGAYVIWHLATQPERLRSIACLLILAAFLFLNWKHGFVRADGHMLGFFYCALIPAVCFPALFGERVSKPWVPRIITLVIAGLCLTGMRNTFTTTIDYAPNIANEKLQRNIQAVLNWNQARANLEGQVDHWQREADLPKTRELIGDASVDVLGFEQAIALFNGFNYTPRPIFQSYSVYTPHLAELNAAFITSESAPEFLLLKMQTIDERPHLADDSHLMVLFPHLYEFRLLEKDFYLFERRREPADLASLSPQLVRTADVKLEEEFSVEEFSATHLWVEIDFPFNLLGRARNFLYKPALVYLIVTDYDGKEERYRIPRPIALAGFQINPLVTDFETYLEAHGGDKPRLIRSIRIEVADEDRRWFAEQALVSVSTLKSTNLKTEYAQQLERQRFASFSHLPDDFFARTPLSNEEIDGREAVIMHAPSEMTFPLSTPITAIRGAHGYPAGAYTNGGETDGATFVIKWTDGADERILYERRINPFVEPADQGLLDFDLQNLNLPARGEVQFIISINENPGWDWTAWAGITLE